MKHATVKIGDYTIPLIGIGESATQDNCDKCGTLIHITELQFQADGVTLLCKKCGKKKGKLNE